MSKQVLAQIKGRIQESVKADTQALQVDLSEIQIQNFCPAVNSLIEKHPTIEVLHLTSCGLKSLKNFPKLKNLVAIDLTKNQLNDDSSLEVLCSFPNLTQIIMNENKIERIQTIQKFSSLNKLVQIDLEGNPVSQEPKFSQTIFEKFANIEYVNRKDKDGNPQPEEEQQNYDEDEDDDQEQEDYEEEDEQDFEEDDYEQQQSDQKPKKGGRKKK